MAYGTELNGIENLRAIIVRLLKHTFEQDQTITQEECDIIVMTPIPAHRSAIKFLYCGDR